MGRPTRLHEARKETLSAMATLCGFTQNLAGRFPDGSKPDVLRLAAAQRAIFIGEAKAMEPASDRAVAVRLSNYMTWLRAAHSGSVFALGVDRTDAREWRVVVTTLAAELDLGLSPVIEIDLEELLCLWWTKL